MDSFQQTFGKFVLLWTVIDPIGTIPLFNSTTADRTLIERRRIALTASLTAAGVLLFFIAIREPIRVAMGVPLPAFQIVGGMFFSCSR